MHPFACSSASGSSIASISLFTATDSPVSDACSSRIVAVFRVTTRASAGTRSPVRTSTTSPGTRSRAWNAWSHLPSRSTRAVSDCISLSASSAFSAFDSCHTPTMALRIKMRRMTPGSTKSTRSIGAPGARSSTHTSANDTAAAASRIFTSASSNCSSTSFHSGLPSSLSSSFGPCLASASRAAADVRPLAGSTPCADATSDADAAHGAARAEAADAPFLAAVAFDGVLPFLGGMVDGRERRRGERAAMWSARRRADLEPRYSSPRGRGIGRLSKNSESRPAAKYSYSSCTICAYSTCTCTVLYKSSISFL